MAARRAPAGTPGGVGGQFVSAGDTQESIRLLLSGEADLTDIYNALAELTALGGEAQVAAQNVFKALNQSPDQLQQAVRHLNSVSDLTGRWSQLTEQVNFNMDAAVDHAIRFAETHQLSERQLSAIVNDLAKIEDQINH